MQQKNRSSSARASQSNLKPPSSSPKVPPHNLPSELPSSGTTLPFHRNTLLGEMCYTPREACISSCPSFPLHAQATSTPSSTPSNPTKPNFPLCSQAKNQKPPAGGGCPAPRL